MSKSKKGVPKNSDAVLDPPKVNTGRRIRGGEEGILNDPDNKYKDMPLEELESLLRKGEGVMDGPMADPIIDGADGTDEREVEFPLQKPEENEEAEAPDEGGEPVRSVEQESEPREEEAEEERPDSFEVEKEELRLQAERFRQMSEKQELLASRRAGEIGYLKQQIESLRTAPSYPQQEQSDQEWERSQQQQDPERSALESRLRQLEEQTRARTDEDKAVAMKEEYEGWRSRVSDELAGQGIKKEEIGERINAMLKEMAPRLESEIEPFKQMDLNAKSTRKVVRMALDAAYTDFRLASLQKSRESAMVKKRAQVEKSRSLKAEASVGGTGGTPSGLPQRKPISEMTAEEADAALRSLNPEQGRIRRYR